jgi:hypothetical protein
LSVATDIAPETPEARQKRARRAVRTLRRRLTALETKVDRMRWVLWLVVALGLTSHPGLKLIIERITNGAP